MSNDGDNGEWQPPPEWSAGDGATPVVFMPELFKQVCEENGINPDTGCLPDGRKPNIGYLMVCKKLGHPYPSFEPKAPPPQLEEPLPAVDPGRSMAGRSPEWSGMAGRVPLSGPYNKKMPFKGGMPAHQWPIPSPVEQEEEPVLAVPERQHPIALARLAKEVSQPPVPLAAPRIGQLKPFPPHDNSLRHVKSLIHKEFERLAAKRAEEDKALALAASEATVAKLLEKSRDATRTITWSVNIGPGVVLIAGAVAAYAAYLYWTAA